jgi:hypothetical protein
MNDGPGRPGHERCGGRTRSGRPCKLPAGHGTDHPGIGRCDHHGGATPTHQAHARRVLAEQAVQAFGLPVQTTPERALLDEVNRTLGHVVWLGARVAELEPATVVWGERRRTVRAAGDGEDGGEVTTESGAGVNTWVQLYQTERRHLAEVARVAIATSAAASAAASAAEFGQRMANVLEHALADLHWAERDAILTRFTDELELRVLPGGGDGGDSA